MKNININKSKSLFLALGLACLTSLFITCKNPIDNIQVTTNADFVSAPSEFYIFDASTGESSDAMEGVKVNVTGPAAPYIYGSDGKKAISVFEGAVQISFRNGTVVSEEIPLKFNLEIAVPGYLPIVYPVTLNSLDPVEQDISLVNTNNLPKGAAKINATTTTDQTGANTSLTTVTLPNNANKTEIAELTIPAGIIMKDKDGNPVTGTVSIDVIQFTGREEQSLNSFGNLDDNIIKDINGNIIPNIEINPLGWLNINMKAGNKEVKTFSSPVKAKIGIPAGLVNPQTEAEYKEGDELNIVSLEDAGTEYKNEGTTIIQKATNGTLYVDINISHLSKWTVSKFYQACPLTFSFDLNEQDYQIFSGYVLNNKVKAEKSLLDNIIRGSENTRIAYYDVAKQKFFASRKFKYVKKSFRINGKTITLSINNIHSYGPVALQGSIKLRTKDGMAGEYNLTSQKITTACKSEIIVSPGVASPNLNLKFRGKCTSGNTNYVNLGPGYKVYYMENSVYTSSANPPKISNKLWKKFILDVGASGYNTSTISKSDLKPGTDYRLSLSYGGKSYTYLYNVPAVIPDEISFEISIPCQ